jgi:hypothetical protein
MSNRRLRRAWGAAAFLAGLTLGFSQTATPPDREADAILVQLQKGFQTQDREAYLAPFAPELRDKEWNLASPFLFLWKMTEVRFHKATPLLDNAGAFTLYLQVLYENPTSAMLETWEIGLGRSEAGLVIRSKEVLGNVATLYKLRMPSDRVEKARRVEVRHEDIVFTFDNAWVYYDNLADVETALLVIGDGRLRFSPSSEIERHQLEVRYKTDVLVDFLRSAYLRFSPSFFRNNVTIEPDPGPTAAPPESEVSRAYALFMKHYPASFTVENSLTDDLLTFLPQSDQVVFELKTAGHGELAYIFSPFSEEEIHFLRRNPDQILNLYSPERPGPPGRRMLVSFGQKSDVRRYDIDLDFQPKRCYLSARARVEVGSSIGPLDSLQFNFNSKFEILRVFDEAGRELFYTQDRRRQLLYIYFLRPVEKDKTAAVEIFYRGSLEPPLETTDAVAGGQYGESISLIQPNYESYFYSQSALWYPAPSEDQYFQARLRLIFPPGYVGVANGELVEEGTIDGVRRVLALEKVGNPYRVFTTRVPVKYLSFIIGKFDKVYNGNGGASPPIKVLVSEDIHFQRKSLLDETRRIVESYERWFGPYPFEKLTVLQRLWTTSGGHSPASFLVLNEPRRSTEVISTVVNTDSPVDLSRYGEYYLAHEIAHQWWGQAVMSAGYRDQWLSEGLAQFATAEYLRSKYGERAYADILRKFVQWTEKKSRFGPITLGTRLSLLEFKAYQAVVYNKACLALNMLRDLVGAEAFGRGLRNFFETYKFKSARTAQFARVMEASSGRDLGAFFRGWFDSHLLPDVQVKHEIEKDGDGFSLKVTVHQPTTTFVFPLVVTWREGRHTVRQILDVDAPTKEFAFRASLKPANFKSNPDKSVPGKFFD